MKNISRNNRRVCCVPLFKFPVCARHEHGGILLFLIFSVVTVEQVVATFDFAIEIEEKNRKPKMKLSSILFRDRNRSQAATNNTDNPSAVGFCPPKRDRSKSLCVPHAMPLIRVETCREDGSAAVAGNVQDLLRKRRTSMAV